MGRRQLLWRWYNWCYLVGAGGLGEWLPWVLSLGSELEWPPEPGDTAEKQKGNLEECSMLMVLKGMKGLEIGVQKHPACAPKSPCTNQL